MQEHASVLFADFDDLFALPDSMEGNISYDPDWDAYFVSRGDIGLSEMKLTAYAETEEGYAITAELWSVGESTDLIAAWDVLLTDHAYADGIEDPLYLYRIADMTLLSEEGAAAENSIPTETITAVFTGLSDSHTAEFTLQDGSVAVFQFDGDSPVSDLLSQRKEGDGLTFGYILDPQTGTAKIITIE